MVYSIILEYASNEVKNLGIKELFAYTIPKF